MKLPLRALLGLGAAALAVIAACSDDAVLGQLGADVDAGPSDADVDAPVADAADAGEATDADAGQTTDADAAPACSADGFCREGFAGGKVFVTALYGRASDDVWGVGHPTDNAKLPALVHYDGNAWAEISVDSTTPFVGIHGGDRGDLWIVGDNLFLHGVPGSGGVMHWEEETPPTFVPSPGAGPSSVWASSSDDVWFATAQGLYHREETGDGVVWTVENPWPTPNDFFVSETPFFVTGSGPDDVWCLGSLRPARRTKVGSDIVWVSSPIDPSGGPYLDIWGRTPMALASAGPGSIWFAFKYFGQANSTIYQSTYPSDAGDPDFVVATQLVMAQVRAITNAGSANPWVAGDYGGIAEFTGTHWQLQRTTIDGNLFLAQMGPIWVSSSGEVWVGAAEQGVDAPQIFLHRRAGVGP